MATLPTNELGNSSNLSGTAITGTEPVLELIASANDATYAHSGTNNATGAFTADFALADMPSDFNNMDTLSVQLRYLRAAGTMVNSWDSLQAQVLRADDAGLTDNVTVASSITTTTATNSSVIAFTGVSTGASKATWGNARLRITWNITRSMGGDTIEKRVTAAQLTGTYTAALPAIVGSLAATETGADTFAASGTVADTPVVGTLAATESGLDTFASSGTVLVEGGLDATESSQDSFTSTGQVLVSGSLAVTETGNDTFAATGSVTDQASTGTLAATESGSDTFASSGKVLIAGDLAVSETGSDTLAATGNVVADGDQEPIASPNNNVMAPGHRSRRQLNRKRFDYKLSRKTKKQIEEVANLGLDQREAEIALRLRLSEWEDAYFEVEEILQKAISLQLAKNIQELEQINAETFAKIELEQHLQEMRAIDLARENKKRIAIITMLMS